VRHASASHQDGNERIRYQAEEHPLVALPPEAALGEVFLHLMHLKAYDEATSFVDGREVLDVGCNTGYGTSLLTSRANRVVGVDVSGAAIERAQREYPGIAEWLVVDGRSLPFGDHTFDLVVAFQVLEHLDRPDEYLLEIARVMRRGGTALFTTPNAAVRIDPGMAPWNPFHVREYTAQELAATLGGVFESVEVRGLFAIPELEIVERSRVRSARRRARWRRALASVGGESVARRASGILRAIRARLQQPQGVAAERASRVYSTRDLFYRRDHLDDALDLMAVCESPRHSVNRLGVDGRDTVEEGLGAKSDDD
jgi:SAM-dependent methyltransferase